MLWCLLATWTMNQHLAVGKRSASSPDCRRCRSSPCSPASSVWGGSGGPCILQRMSLNPPSDYTKSPHTKGSCHLFPAASQSLSKTRRFSWRQCPLAASLKIWHDAFTVLLHSKIAVTAWCSKKKKRKWNKEIKKNQKCHLVLFFLLE